MSARIPRFSPSFSLAEAWISIRHLVPLGDEASEVADFEAEFADYIGTRHAVMVPSARYGFYLLLKAWGWGPGDEIILPALTYFAIPALAKTAGCTPVFADIGETSHVLDPAAFEAAITPRTRAVVPTHLFGTPCDMDAIREIAAAHDIRVIEDCAQSTGARWQGNRVGSLGDAAYYTFGLTKNITTLSGAMITTGDDTVAASVRDAMDQVRPGSLWKATQEALTGTAMMFATHPWIYPWTLHPVIVLGNQVGKDPIHDRFGETPRTYPELPDRYLSAGPRGMQAAVGRKQLQRIEALNSARAANGRFLDEALAHVTGLATPTYPAGGEPIYMSFVVHHDQRDDLATALRGLGVDTTVGYMSNCADSDLFPDERADCPRAAHAMANLLHIPVHPNLSTSRLDHIAEATRQACLEIQPQS